MDWFELGVVAALVLQAAVIYTILQGLKTIREVLEFYAEALDTQSTKIHIISEQIGVNFDVPCTDDETICFSSPKSYTAFFAGRDVANQKEPNTDDAN